MENVIALTDRGLDKVLGSLSEIGYNAEWQNISAEAVGAPHKRERIWIVSYPTSMGQPEGATIRGEIPEKIRWPESNIGNNAQKKMAHPTKIRWGMDWMQNRKGYMAGEPLNECNESKRKNTYTATKRLERKITKRESRRKSGLSTECDWWETEPSMGVLVDGLPAGMDRFEGRLTNKPGKEINSQLMGLGNSIIPQIAELLFSRIKEIINENQ